MLLVSELLNCIDELSDVSIVYSGTMHHNPRGSLWCRTTRRSDTRGGFRARLQDELHHPTHLPHCHMPGQRIDRIFLASPSSNAGV